MSNELEEVDDVDFMNEMYSFICQIKSNAHEESNLKINLEVSVKNDNQYTELWTYAGLLFLCIEALLVYMLEYCLQWMRSRRNHQREGRFRFLWVLNYVPIIRHVHHM